MKKKLVILICYVLLEIAEHGQSVELECEKEGFAVVESKNCGVYYYCVKSANNEFNAVKFECPLGEGFSLLKLKCIPEEINECGKLPETPIDDPLLTDEFVCPSSGRFPDFKSPDCKSYYMCNSVLVPVLNKCPSTTIFSWISMKCVVPTAYTCPNSITTTTEASTITTEETTGPGTTSPTDTSTTEVAAITTTEESTSETNEPNAFVCTDIGRFPDPASTDCKTYYLCTISIEGTYEAILNRCPSTTIFSSVDRKCLATGYQCSAGTTAKTDEPSTVESTTSYSTSIEVTTQDTSTTVSSTETPTVTTPEPPTTVTTTDLTIPTTEITTTYEISTSATDGPTTDPAGETFACSESGRFPDPKSIDCKGYYLCSVNLKATLNKCPSVTIFHPESRKCVPPADYQCPTAVTTTQEPTEEPSTVETTVLSSETPTVTTEEPPTTVTTTDLTMPTPKITTTNEISTSAPDGPTTDSPTTTNPTTVASTETPTVTTPEPSTTVATTDLTMPTTEITTTNEISTSVTEGPTTDPPGETFACSESGRFPDPKSSDCKGYYLCTVNLKATLNKCPSVTIFHPESRKCVPPANYQCPTAVTTTQEPTEEPSTVETTVSSSETPAATTAAPSTPVPTTEFPPSTESFVCTDVGRFPDPTSTDCKGYYLCSTTTAGTFQAVRTQCPSVTIFSAEKNRCVLMSQYQCPTPITTSTVEPTTTPETTISSSSATPPTTTVSPVNFICTITGRHPDPTQPDCSKYKYCLLTATNIFLEYTFNCPSGSYFNPLELRCSMDYSCPSLSSAVISEETTELPLKATSFLCTSEGRFPDPTSEGCDTYIMCLRTAVGSFQQYNFKCPIGSLFSPAEAKCSTSYLCK